MRGGDLRGSPGAHRGHRERTRCDRLAGDLVEAARVDQAHRGVPSALRSNCVAQDDRRCPLRYRNLFLSGWALCSTSAHPRARSRRGPGTGSCFTRRREHQAARLMGSALANLSGRPRFESRRTTLIWAKPPSPHSPSCVLPKSRCTDPTSTSGLDDWSDVFVTNVLPFRIGRLAVRRSNHRAVDSGIQGSWKLVATDGPSWKISVHRDEVTSEPVDSDRAGRCRHRGDKSRPAGDAPRASFDRRARDARRHPSRRPVRKGLPRSLDPCRLA